MPTITFTGRDEQPTINTLATHLFFPTAPGAVYPLAFRFDLPDGGSRLAGTVTHRALVITTNQTRLSPKLLETIASRAEAIIRTLYEESDLPVLLEEKDLARLLERDVRLGVPYRSFRFDYWPLTDGEGWGYSAAGRGGTFSEPPLHDHLHDL